MNRPSSAALLACLVLLGTAGLARAWQQGPAPADPAYRTQVETQLQLERRLLALDLAAYREARDRERGALARVAEVSGRLDQALIGESMALGNLEALHDELSAAREATNTAAERVEAQLLRLQDRLRRIGFLQGELGPRATRAPDPVTGRWQVQILPQNVTATFDLRLEGTVVSGTYSIAGGASSGSFRGTFVNNSLRLERIDSKRGFDSVFAGNVGGGRITGIWLLNEMATGSPARGDWTATRENGP
jgi:hypothetical protein